MSRRCTATARTGGWRCSPPRRLSAVPASRRRPWRHSSRRRLVQSSTRRSSSPRKEKDVESGNSAYQTTAAEALAALASDPQRGLTRQEAEARLSRHGRNELAAEKPVPAWRRVLEQLQDVLVILLLVATAISACLWLIERETALPYEAIAILAVLLLNAVMGYVQQSHAQQAVAALQRMSAAKASVVRDGAQQSIPASELVPGDILLVEEGNTVPADARLLQSAALQTAEAALTGESLPMTKDVAVIAEEVPLGDQSNMIFSGTSITYGHGRAVITATGMDTQIGRIAQMLNET